LKLLRAMETNEIEVELWIDRASRQSYEEKKKSMMR